MSIRILVRSTLLAGITSALPLAASPASAMGDDSDTTPTCKAGQVYDQKTHKCVQQSSANLTDGDLATYAYSLAKAGRYQEALDVIAAVKNQDDPVVLNYRGYATRKLGRTDEGISYYLRSVAADPSYARVREYLGEAYVIKGRIDLARAQLATIRTLCGTGCEEYRDLKEAIDAPSRG